MPANVMVFCWRSKLYIMTMTRIRIRDSDHLSYAGVQRCTSTAIPSTDACKNLIMFLVANLQECRDVQVLVVEVVPSIYIRKVPYLILDKRFSSSGLLKKRISNSKDKTKELVTTSTGI
jgi:hypothetical protein